jgi:cellobiose transport system substrate-binding protein
MVLASALLAGCGSSGGSSAKTGDPNAEFTFWSFTGIGAKDSVKEYQAKNPDAKVKQRP